MLPCEPALYLLHNSHRIICAQLASSSSRGEKLWGGGDSLETRPVTSACATPPTPWPSLAPGGDGQALVIAESARFSTLDCSVKYFSRKTICYRDLLCSTDSTRCIELVEQPFPACPSILRSYSSDNDL